MIQDTIEVNGVVIKTKDFVRIANIKNTIDDVEKVRQGFAKLKDRTLNAKEVYDCSNPELRLLILVQIKYLIQDDNIIKAHKSLKYPNCDSGIFSSYIFDALSSNNKKDNKGIIRYKQIQEFINRTGYRINPWRKLKDNPSLHRLMDSEKEFLGGSFEPSGKNFLWTPSTNEPENITDRSVPIKNTDNHVPVQDVINAELQPSAIDNSTLNQPLKDDTSILEFAQGDAQSGLNLFRSGHVISPEELKEAKQKAEYNGHLGEKLIDSYLELCVKQKNILKYEWVSQKNSVSPYDFKLTDNSGIDFLIEVKSTSENFTSRIYISKQELVTMTQSQEYYILYRVYNISETGGVLRIAKDMKPFAEAILNSIDALPSGVNVNSFSIDVKEIEKYFDKSLELSFPKSE